MVTGLSELDGNRSLTFLPRPSRRGTVFSSASRITKDELFGKFLLSDAMRYHIIVDDAHTTRVGFTVSPPNSATVVRVETFTNGGRSAESVRVDGCLVNPNSNRRNVKVGEAGMVHFIDGFCGAKALTDAGARQRIRQIGDHLSMFANALRGSEVMNTFDGVTSYTVFAPIT